MTPAELDKSSFCVFIGIVTAILLIGAAAFYISNDYHKRHTWWKLLSRVFKYDYLYLECQEDRSNLVGIARIHKDGNGEAYVNLVYNGKFSYIKPLDEIINEKKEKKFTNSEPEPKWKIIWLTCSSKKYAPMDEDEWLKKVKEVVDEA